jgi:hypothetical protein
MAYTEEVFFRKTNQYGSGEFDEDDVYTVEEFAELVKGDWFIDYDGWGHPVKDKLADPSIDVYPSQFPRCMPKDATHVVWYNK